MVAIAVIAQARVENFNFISISLLTNRKLVEPASGTHTEKMRSHIRKT
jgi:hypothetical protein